MRDPFPAELFIHINLTLILLTLCLLVIIVRFMLTDLVHYGWVPDRLRGAISIGVFLGGETIRIGWVWLLRIVEYSGGNVKVLTQLPFIALPLVGTVLEIVGMLCMIRVFSPDDWGRYAWLACAALTLSLVVTEIWIVSG